MYAGEMCDEEFAPNSELFIGSLGTQQVSYGNKSAHIYIIRMSNGLKRHA